MKLLEHIYHLHLHTSTRSKNGVGNVKNLIPTKFEDKVREAQKFIRIWIDKSKNLEDFQQTGDSNKTTLNIS